MEKPYLVQLIALRDRKISTGLLELFIVKADSDLISGFSRYSSSIGRLRLTSLPPFVGMRHYVYQHPVVPLRGIRCSARVNTMVQLHERAPTGSVTACMVYQVAGLPPAASTTTDILFSIRILATTRFMTLLSRRNRTSLIVLREAAPKI